MIETYVHTIYYTNGSTQTFDSDRLIDFESHGFLTINFPKGNRTIINTEQVNCIDVKHLTLTEEEYQKRKELLKNK